MKELDFSKVDVLLSHEEIIRRTRGLALQISDDYLGMCPIVIGVLNGCQHFYSTLTLNMTCPLMTDFMAVSSYGNSKQSSGKLTILKDLSLDITDRDVLLVEDIVDTGLTITMLKQLLLDRGAKSVKVATMLDKPSRRKFDLVPEYVAFTIDDVFVFGYGLDYEGYYRNVDYIGVYKGE